MEMKRHGFSFRLEFAQRLFGLFLFFVWVAEDWNQSGQQGSAPGKLRGKATAELRKTSVLTVQVHRVLRPKLFSDPSSQA